MTDQNVNDDTSKNASNDAVSSDGSPVVVPRHYLVAFVLITCLFPLWGFANDITNPMVAAFKKILLLSHTQSSWVQSAFYGGYCLMAIPAALFIKRFSYKKGILVGLALYSGAALFFPVAGYTMSFGVFLLAYLVMTSGLSFLETTANPYILSLGPAATATRRLNLAQSFNPMGSLTGMFVAMTFILANLAMVNHDPDFAPILAGEAQDRIAVVVESKEKGDITLENEELNPQEMSLDAIKLAKIKELNLDSWIPGKDDIAKQIKEEKEVQWPAMLIELQTTQERLAQTLAIVSSEATDSQKWEQITHDQLDKDLTDEQRKVIDKNIANNKTVDWDINPVLDGSPDEEQARRLIALVDSSKWESIQIADLKVVQGPYFAIGIVVFAVFIVFFVSKLPESEADSDTNLHVGGTLERLLSNPRYLGGVIAQAFYVGAQIMCWTFIIQYAGKELGMRAADAQAYNIVAMVIFVSSRFICTFLLKFFNPGILLATLAACAAGLTLGTIFVHGMPGLYCLIGISACMSLMFPTIYGLALEGLGDDAKLGAAGLILAIGGGCLMPPMQASIMDMEAFQFGSTLLSSMRVSFVLVFVCFLVIVAYGLFARDHRKSA